MLRDAIADRRDYEAWANWTIAHCRLVAVSAGGFGSSNLQAYHCDDNRDYIQEGFFAPRNWRVQ